MSSFYDEDYFDKFKEWLETIQEQSITHKQLLEKFDKDFLYFIEKAFLDGFEAGRERRMQDNWNLWNQK